MASTKLCDLGQHFLTNSDIVEKAVGAANIISSDIILEIGPGKGIITEKIAKKAKKVIAVEIDKSLNQYLKSLPVNVEIIYGNIFDLFDSLEFNKIISNIPYNISEQLINRIIMSKVELAVLFTGERFANILLNKGSKWNIITGLFFDIELLSKVPRQYFYPVPRTDSALICLKRKNDFASGINKAIKEIILNPSKKTKNAIISAFINIQNKTKKQAKNALKELNLSESILNKSPYELSNIQFRKMYELLSKVF